MAFVTVFLAFERPSILQWTCLHPLACNDNEPVGSGTRESKSSSLSGCIESLPSKRTSMWSTSHD